MTVVKLVENSITFYCNIA